MRRAESGRNELLVTGTLVGDAEYSSGVASSVSGAGGNSAQTVSKAFQIRAEAAERENSNAFYIHLRDAYTIWPDGRLPSRQAGGVWWRGRISSVDCWCFGEIEI